MKEAPRKGRQVKDEGWAWKDWRVRMEEVLPTWGMKARLGKEEPRNRI